MNAQQIKDTIRKFKAADLTQVKDAELRAKGEKLQAKQGGFTLLELLVVVAILAVIAGAVISSLSGKEESAAQKTAVHTMAAVENSMRVFSVEEKRVLPEGLDSLICTTGVALNASGALAVDLASLNSATSSAVLSNNGSNSNVARVDGGLTEDLAGKLEVVDVTSGALTALADNGLTNLRYATFDICNDVEDANAIETGVEDEALVEVVKPSLIFQDAVVEGGDWEFGAGAAADFSGDLSAFAGTVPVAFFAEPAELGADEGDVLAVFGVGSGTELGSVIARAPQDGNAPADKYSNYSIVVKVAECPDGEELEDINAATPECVVADWEEVGEEMEVVAIIDAGGDGYDDEIAEAKGNQEE